MSLLGNQIRRETNKYCLELCNATTVPMSNQVCMCVFIRHKIRSVRHTASHPGERESMFVSVCVFADISLLGQLMCISISLGLQKLVKPSILSV